MTRHEYLGDTTKWLSVAEAAARISMKGGIVAKAAEAAENLRSGGSCESSIDSDSVHGFGSRGGGNGNR